jgi:hypothetical protein
VRTRALSRSTRLSFIRSDKEGVASTVGTIMALLVFLAFMTLITNNYVPAWMLDNERQHMNQVIDQFGQMKGKVDSMIIQMEVTGAKGTKMYAPISLGSEGVPLFATPTGGILNYIPQGSNVSGIWFNYTSTSHPTSLITGQIGGGKVDLVVPNRYYIQQTVAYENGAIIVKQNDGQTIQAYPNLEINKITGAITLSFTQIDLLGTNQSMSGSDSMGFNMDLKYIDGQTYNLESGTLDITLRTAYQQAWVDFLNLTLKNTGLVKGTDYVFNPPTLLPDKATYQIVLTLKNVDTVYYSRALVEMSTLT